MNIKLKKKNFFIKIYLTFSLFCFSLEQCVLGVNCPRNQGICVGDQCSCLNGFYSLLDVSLPPEKQVFCNYEQINVYIPLILEIFLPSIGHFYAGKYWMGLLKLFLLIIHISVSLKLFGFIGVPKFLILFMDRFGISLRNFCPEGSPELKTEEEGGDDDTKKDDNDDNEKDEKDEKDEKVSSKKIGSLSTSLMPIKYLLRNKTSTDENINRGKITQIKQIHNDEGNDYYSLDMEKTPTPIEEEEKSNSIEEEPEEEKNETLLLIFHASTIAFWTLYLLDLFLYKFKIYDDGNDIPFIE